MNDPQEIYRQWADKQAAMGRRIPDTTAPGFQLPTKIEVTITDGPDPDAPIPDPSLTVTRRLAEKPVSRLRPRDMEFYDAVNEERL